MSLKEYRRKRKFEKTPEPAGKEKKTGRGALRFYIQKHAATRTHYDFRLEMDGVLKSWAVPKGPSLNPQDQRLAVFVEDHPLEYGRFEGIIPPGNYGAGTVMVWDLGTYVERGSKTREESEVALREGMAKGHVTFVVKGKKLQGEFALIRLKRSDPKNWLLIKKRDESSRYTDILTEDRSALSSRTLKEIADQAKERGTIWLSRGKTARNPPEDPKPNPPHKGEKPPAPKGRGTPSLTGQSQADNSYEKALERYRAATALKAKTTKLNGPTLTHLDKIFWPKEKITKGDVIEYYRAIAPFILPHLKDRPESLHRHPNGITKQSFFQKDVTGYLPSWVSTEKIYSESAGRTIQYVLCQNESSLLYLANLGCIELNPWISRVGHLDRPDYIVIDLDPDENDFDEVIELAHATHDLLEEIGAKSYCKTSGATGIHVVVPTQGSTDFDEGRLFAQAVVEKIHQRYPKNTSIERSPAKRRRKIYLDFLQNRRGQTLAAPYCIRPRPGGTVSTPLLWKELKKGLRPEAFTLETVPKRLKRVGDLWKPVLHEKVNLAQCAKKLARL